MFFLFPYFILKLFCSFCTWLLISPEELSPNLLVKFSFVILKSSVLFVLFDTSPLSFLSSFVSIFLSIYLFLLVVVTDLSVIVFWGSFHVVDVLCVSPFFAISIFVTFYSFGLLVPYSIQVLYFCPDS